MTFGPVNAESSFLPVDFDLPKDDTKSHIDFIIKRERLTASIVNVKENGNFELAEIVSGQQWFTTNTTPNINTPRLAFRKVVNFGTLPSSTTTTKPHGIAVTQTTIFTHIYGCATNPNTKFIPLPYINTGTPGDSVEVWVDATNVNIKTTTGNYTGFTTTYVILEYIKF